MATRESYDPGIPSWIDLMSPDVEGSKQFYAGLFGWEAEDQLDDEGNLIYTMFRRAGHDVAGLGGPMPGTEGRPAVWHCYINTEDADATVLQAEAAGGTVMVAPMDVTDAGRMAVLQDPSGATISIWQPREHIGARLVNGPGAFGWSELLTRQPQQVRSFYEQTFGWQLLDQNMEPMGTYTVATLDGRRSFAGIMEMPADVPDEVPNYWTVYLGHDDVDAACEQVRELGGDVVAGPFPIAGVGRAAVVHDPQGGTFTVMSSDNWED